MEHTPDVLRFERIEAAHETLAKAVAAIASGTHTAFAALNTSQQHRMEELQRIVAQLGKQDTNVHALFKLKTDQDKKLNALTAFMSELVLSQTAAEVQIGKIADAQIKLAGAQAKQAGMMANLAEAQTKSETAQAETQGKFDALIHMWDDWIIERGGKNGKPTPEPPPSA